MQAVIKPTHETTDCNIARVANGVNDSSVWIQLRKQTNEFIVPKGFVNDTLNFRGWGGEFFYFSLVGSCNTLPFSLLVFAKTFWRWLFAVIIFPALR